MKTRRADGPAGTPRQRAATVVELLLPQRLRNVPHQNKEKNGQPKTGDEQKIDVVLHDCHQNESNPSDCNLCNTLCIDCVLQKTHS